jgi:mannan endo-1,4-beta-mannosidase
MIARRVAATVLATALIAAGADVPSARATAPHVGVSKTSLTLDGKPWWPVGMNAYQLGTNWDVNAGCGAQVDLDDYFDSLPPRSLTRVPFYTRMAVNKKSGTLDFSALDAVFAAAARHSQLVVAVLSGHDGFCEDEHPRDHAWYAGGWRSDERGSPMTFAAWLDTAVARWARSPALAGWTAVGEPEASDCGSADCVWRSRTCSADAAAVLRAFFDATGARIRQLDPQAVIWSGLAGGGQCGSAGDDFATLASSPGVDVLEYHDYRPSPVVPDELARRIAQAHAAGKPLVVAELGLESGSCVPLAQRKSLLADTIRSQRAHGTAGALFWSFVPDPRADQCTLDIGPGDPLQTLVGGPR